MQFTNTLLIVVCLALSAVSAKTKKYSLSGKRAEAGKYARRCEKDDRQSLIMDEEAEIKEIAKFMLSKNVHSAWIGGVTGTKYDGEFVLTVDAKKKGKYESHTITLVPANKTKYYSGEHFALCRRNDE